MESLENIQRRCGELGLATDPKYRFRFGPLGLPISAAEKSELEEIGRAAADYLRAVDHWYHGLRESPRGSPWCAILHKGVPGDILSLPWRDRLPTTFMVDTTWTVHGWRVVEIDATNRNAFGFPIVMRQLYQLPSLWEGIDVAWRRAGWSGVTQIMARLHRFYVPYFRAFLRRVDGRLIAEDGGTPEKAGLGPFLDLPILYWNKPVLERLLERGKEADIFGIPPKHYLGSKAALTLPWEEEFFREHPITKYLPQAHLLQRSRPRPPGEFMIKLLQSNGSHGVFMNDAARLAAFGQERRAQAIWQTKLPRIKRRIMGYDETGATQEYERYIRVSIFVTADGTVVDADATACDTEIVHGGVDAILTVPVAA
ncbi:MAG: hypothetical protein HY984_01960 [Candidatus Magasanikbacteria bacterium]|nr:hypothetical protein [Candidatus Magasanikbacteria bacterium]